MIVNENEKIRLNERGHRINISLRMMLIEINYADT